MTEPTFTLKYDDLYQEVRRYVFGVARTTTLVDTTDADTHGTVLSIIRRGLRQFYYPPPLIRLQERKSHTWSFLQPVATKVVGADPSGTTTTAVTTNQALVDDTTTDFAASPYDTTVANSELAGTTLTYTNVSTGTSYTNTINSVTDSDNLVMTTAWTAAQVSGASTSDTYSIALDGDWNLPDNFGGLIGNITFATSTVYPPIQQTSQQRIRQLRMDSTLDQTERPRLCAIRPRAVADTAAASTRWELMLWPRPDATYTLEYKYQVNVDHRLNTDVSSNPDAHEGGPGHSETVMASCLAIAEEFVDPTRRTFRYRELFMERLEASVMLDRQLMAPDNLGYNHDRSDGMDRTLSDRFNAVTYNSVEYP